MPVTRTYECLNRHCRRQFNSTANHPPCPRCRGIHVKWVPGTFAILAKAPAVDRTVRDLAETQDVKNFRSPKRGRGVALPRAPVPASSGRTMPFTPTGASGWTAQVPVDAKGAPIAACVPTNVTAPLPIGKMGQIDKVQEKNGNFGEPVPLVQARHRPRGGIPK